jgi:hypothetical protein
MRRPRPRCNLGKNDLKVVTGAGVVSGVSSNSLTRPPCPPSRPNLAAHAGPSCRNIRDDARGDSCQISFRKTARGIAAKAVATAAGSGNVSALDLPTLLYAFRNWSVHGNALDGSFGSRPGFLRYVGILQDTLAEIHLATSTRLSRLRHGDEGVGTTGESLLGFLPARLRQCTSRQNASDGAEVKTVERRSRRTGRAPRASTDCQPIFEKLVAGAGFEPATFGL